MTDQFWAALIRPFAILVILVVIGIPITYAVKRFMPESKFKALLLDRTLVDRRPWVGWAAFFACYAVLVGVAWVIALVG